MKKFLFLFLNSSLLLSSCSTSNNGSFSKNTEVESSQVEDISSKISKVSSNHSLKGTVTLAQYALEAPLLVYLTKENLVDRHYAPEGIYYFDSERVAYTTNEMLQKKKIKLSFTQLSKMSDQEIINKITDEDGWIYWDTPYFFCIFTDKTGNNIEYIPLDTAFNLSTFSSKYHHALSTTPVNYEIYDSQYIGYKEEFSDGKQVLVWRLPKDIENIILDDIKSNYSNVLVDPTLDEVRDFYSQYDFLGHSIYDEEEKNSNQKSNYSSSNQKDSQSKEFLEQSQPIDSTDYILPQSSTQLLSSQDIASLTLQELNYARNEIFARHGRMFKSQELQNYFNSRSWYTPFYSPDTFDDSILSDIENQNIQTLLNAEHAINPNGYSLS